MLRIRLTRIGKRTQPSFRVVVAEHSQPVRRGKYVELLGFYNPAAQPKVVELKKERIEYWISKGAKPSDTVAALLKREGYSNMDQYMELRNKARKKKSEKEEAEEAPAAEAKVSAPAESAPTETTGPAKEEKTEASAEAEPANDNAEAPAAEAKAEAPAKAEPANDNAEAKEADAPAKEEKAA